MRKSYREIQMVREMIDQTTLSLIAIILTLWSLFTGIEYRNYKEIIKISVEIQELKDKIKELENIFDGL